MTSPHVIIWAKVIISIASDSCVQCHVNVTFSSFIHIHLMIDEQMLYIIAILNEIVVGPLRIWLYAVLVNGGCLQSIATKWRMTFPKTAFDSDYSTSACFMGCYNFPSVFQHFQYKFSFSRTLHFFFCVSVTTSILHCF